MTISKKRVPSHRKPWLWVAIASIVLVVLVLIFGPAPSWLAGDDLTKITDPVKKLDQIRELRSQLLTAAGGVAAMLTLSLTASSYLLNRRGQMTGRYANAVSMIAGEKLDERVGGIHALRHLMDESPVDHDAIVDVLEGYIVARSHEDRTQVVKSPDDDVAPNFAVRRDIQVALESLGDQPRNNGRQILLVATKLIDLRVRERNFEHISFSGSSFSGKFYKCSFTDCQLNGILIADCIFEEVIFHNCSMERIKGSRGTFQGVRISGGSSVSFRNNTINFTAIDTTVHFAKIEFPDDTRNTIRGTHSTRVLDVTHVPPVRPNRIFPVPDASSPDSDNQSP